MTRSSGRNSQPGRPAARRERGVLPAPETPASTTARPLTTMPAACRRIPLAPSRYIDRIWSTGYRTGQRSVRAVSPIRQAGEHSTVTSGAPGWKRTTSPGPEASRSTMVRARPSAWIDQCAWLSKIVRPAAVGVSETEIETRMASGLAGPVRGFQHAGWAASAGGRPSSSETTENSSPPSESEAVTPAVTLAATAASRPDHVAAAGEAARGLAELRHAARVLAADRQDLLGLEVDRHELGALPGGALGGGLAGVAGFHGHRYLSYEGLARERERHRLRGGSRGRLGPPQLDLDQTGLTQLAVVVGLLVRAAGLERRLGGTGAAKESVVAVVAPVAFRDSLLGEGGERLPSLGELARLEVVAVAPVLDHETRQERPARVDVEAGDASQAVEEALLALQSPLAREQLRRLLEHGLVLHLDRDRL